MKSKSPVLQFKTLPNLFFIYYFPEIFLLVPSKKLTLIKVGFPGSLAGKESACNAGDLGSIPGLGISPGEGKGFPLQYSDLENSKECIVHGVAKSRT